MSVKVNILGSDWEVGLASEREYSGLRNRMGCCDKTSKKITLLSDYDTTHYYAWDNLDEQMMITARHEIIHAFLFECGLNDMANDECFVEWIAVQFPKMLKVFQELGCI